MPKARTNRRAASSRVGPKRPVGLTAAGFHRPALRTGRAPINSGTRIDKTEWHRVVSFQSGLIDMLEKHAKKGRHLVRVAGRRLQFLDKPAGGSGNGAQSPNGDASPAAAGSGAEECTGDLTPFIRGRVPRPSLRGARPRLSPTAARGPAPSGRRRAPSDREVSSCPLTPPESMISASALAVMTNGSSSKTAPPSAPS